VANGGRSIARQVAQAENDVLAFMMSPRAHWPQIYSSNPLERLNAEIKRRTNVVGIYPDDASITRLVGAMMLEQNDEWGLNRRYLQLGRSANPLRYCADSAARSGSLSDVRLQPVRAVDLHHV
jgi:transposase-like protein